MKACKLRIRGGLGNQLFQFFAGAYLARQFSCPLIIDDKLVKVNTDPERRNWLEKLSKKSLSYLGVKRVGPQLSCFISQVMELLPSNVVFTLKEVNISDLSHISQPFISVEGWYQTPQYVNSFNQEKFFESILYYTDFNSKNYLLTYGSDLQNAGIHLRLGDYVKHGWQIPFDWYFKRIDEMRNLGINRIFVFSDEIVVVKKVLKERYDQLLLFTFPEEGEKLNSLELMLSMSFFKNFISSNSTLAWWSTFIGHTSKNVIMTPWSDDLNLPNWRAIKP